MTNRPKVDSRTGFDLNFILLLSIIYNGNSLWWSSFFNPNPGESTHLAMLAFFPYPVCFPFPFPWKTPWGHFLN